MKDFLKRIGSPRQLKAELKRDGWRAVVKRRGTPLLVAIFVYYLIRDSFLYILLPFLVAKGLLSGFTSLF